MPNDPAIDPLLESPSLHRYFQKSSDRASATRAMFDACADLYDKLERWSSFGRGASYRRLVLQEAGLQPGMSVLDVATGTGLVAREALSLIGPEGRLVGLDPSSGMLQQARQALRIQTVQACAESIPLPDASFDFLSMGYALRHVADLRQAFGEFFRVLKPGGKVCILEIVRPPNPMVRGLVKFYLRHLVPGATRFFLGRRDAAEVWEYYWDTIEACVPAPQIEKAMRDSGFAEVRSRLRYGVFREYHAQKSENSGVRLA